MKNDQDIALLGSGPINLLKAYFILKKGVKSITIFDSADRLGGAWYSDLSPNGKEIECGCHIWSYCPEAYQFIEKELKIKLFETRPRPVFNNDKINLSYSLKSKIDSYKYIIKNSLTFNFNNLKTIKNHPGVYFRLLGKKNKYPKLGSPEIINTLKSILESDKRVNIILNEKIESIEINHTVRLVSYQKSYTCDKIYLTSTSCINEIKNLNSVIDLKHTTSDYIHFLTQISAPALKSTSYLRLMNDKIIHRVTDISYQTDFNENLFLFGIKPESFKKFNQADIMSHLYNYLLSQKIIDKSYKLKFIKQHIFPTHYTNQKTRDNINLIDQSKIELIHSTDLMHGFFHLIKKHTT